MALNHRTHTFSAEDLLNLFAVFKYSDFLQIGFERPVRGPQRKAAVVTKGRRFSTGFALSHF